MQVVRIFLGFVFAVVVTFTLAAIASTQSVVANLADMGVPLSFDQRIDMTLHDIVGMALIYGGLIALSFLIAFPIAGWISKRLGGLRLVGFMLAGALAVYCLNLGLNSIFDTTLIAVSRTGLGLATQVLSGLVGGYCYLLIRDEAKGTTD